MNCLRISGLVLLGVACILQLQSPVAAMEAEDAPSAVTINYLVKLYQAVEFDHQLHTDMYQCNACHHHTTGDLPANESCRSCHGASKTVEELSCSGCHTIGQMDHRDATSAQSPYHIDMPDFKGAIHLQCLGCHSAESGPTGCQDCHAFTPAGQKRFMVPDNDPALTGVSPINTSATRDKSMGGE